MAIKFFAFFSPQSVLSDMFDLNGRHHWQLRAAAQRCGTGGCRSRRLRKIAPQCGSPKLLNGSSQYLCQIIGPKRLVIFQTYSPKWFPKITPNLLHKIDPQSHSPKLISRTAPNSWLLIKIPLSRNGHSSRIKILLSRNFNELHVYLSRGPCWPITPLIKIRLPPAKLRQRITDHFLVAF